MMRFLVGALLLAGIASPSMATVFNNGTVSAGANVLVGNAITSGSSSGPSSSIVPSSLASTSTAGADDGNGNTAAALHRVTGIWASADAGTIDVEWGWVSATSGVITEINTNVTVADWTYNFTATGNGTFSGNYNVLGQGDTFGLQPIYGGDSVPFGPYGGTVADPTGSGSFSIGLVNGQTYNMRLFNFGNIRSDGGLTLAGNARAMIDWKIDYSNVVPEPTSWAMLITGFGLIGASARRRRAVAA